MLPDDQAPMGDVYNFDTQSAAPTNFFSNIPSGDAFNINNSALWTPDLSSMGGAQRDQFEDGLSKALPTNPNVLTNMLEALAQKRLNNQMKNTLNERSLWELYCQQISGALSDYLITQAAKRLGNNDLCLIMSGTPEGHSIDAWNRALQAVRSVYPPNVYGRNAYLTAKANALKALAQAQKTYKSIPAQNSIPPEPIQYDRSTGEPLPATNKMPL